MKKKRKKNELTIVKTSLSQIVAVPIKPTGTGLYESAKLHPKNSKINVEFRIQKNFENRGVWID